MPACVSKYLIRPYLYSLIANDDNQSIWERRYWLFELKERPSKSRTVRQWLKCVKKLEQYLEVSSANTSLLWKRLKIQTTIPQKDGLPRCKYLVCIPLEERKRWEDASKIIEEENQWVSMCIGAVTGWYHMRMLTKAQRKAIEVLLYTKDPEKRKEIEEEYKRRIAKEKRNESDCSDSDEELSIDISDEEPWHAPRSKPIRKQ